MENNSYVYQHVCNTTGEIFYIGIGTYKKTDKYQRAYSLKNRNRIWHQYVKKHGDFRVEIIMDRISRTEASELEMRLIKQIGRIVDRTGRLANISFGGERTFYGMIRTPEHSKKISEAQKGKKYSPATIEKMRLAKLGKPLKEEQKVKIGKAHKGKINSKETRKRMSIAQMGNQNCLGRKMTEENKIKLSQANSKKIFCITNNRAYDSAVQAARELGISDKHIGSVCNGTRIQTHGYKFRYL